MGKFMKRMLTSLGAAAFALTLITMAAPPASAAELPTCHKTIDPPEYNPTTGFIGGRASREGCEQRRDIHILVREDITFDGDKTIAENRYTNVVNGVFVAFKVPCSRGDAGDLYTEMRTSSGSKVQSARVHIVCNFRP